MNRTWTQEQQTAIDHRGNTLLVSAAAGSGKTAVLVERVLRMLLDPENPQDIDRFLIVTFTKAAASEMRGKIADALTKASAQNPQDARLRRQLTLVHRAKITTVHAFCMGLLREHYHELGLAADFRTADEDEQAALKQEVLEEVLEHLYDAEEEGFRLLADVLSAGRDDRRLAEVILETFETLQASPNPRRVLEGYRADFVQPFDRAADSIWGRELLAEAKDRTAYGIALLEAALDDMQSAPEVLEKYEPAFRDDWNQARTLATLLEDGAWDAAVEQCQALCSSRMRLAAVRGYEDKDYLERLKNARAQWKSLSDGMAADVLCITEQEVREDQARMAPAVCALCGAVQAFSDAYEREKRRRGLVDFNDLEHLALRLLVEEDGSPTALARELHFAEIMVDEYQDTNAVQDAIFRAVSENEENLFMVGDVKQSIYRFRLANPTIFLQRYRAYQDAGASMADGPARVVLSRNFRSRPPVLEAVNFLFSHVMSQRLGDLDYTAREALYPGAGFPETDGDTPTEFCLLETKTEEEDAPQRVELEADYVAGRIESMLRGGYSVTDSVTGRLRPCRPEDFVVLLRSAKTKAPVYQQALLRHNIAASCDAQTDLLAAPEALALISYLEIIDNPRQDVPLLAVLRSLLGGFTEQELADIRLHDLEHDFYTALTLDEGEKAKAFLAQLADFRTLAPDLPVQQLLWHVIDRTRAMAYYGAMPGGEQRQRNITALLELAGSFERSGSRGLFAFVRRLREQMGRGNGMLLSDSEGAGGAVRILTIHKSKGLEFPIVFVAECAAAFNEMDLRKNVLVHERMGISMRCRDVERGIQYDGLDRLAMQCAMRREMLSEELRVLYVALTRAKEKLILTCSVPNAKRTAEQWAAMAALEPIPSYALASVRSYAPWLGAPLLRHPAAQELRALCVQPPELELDAPDCFAVHVVPYQGLTQQAEEAASEGEEEELTLVAPELTPYAGEALANLPSKLTATGIPDTFRAQETMEQTPSAKPVQSELRRPRFQREEVPLSPAEIGTAHHLFLQFCSYARCETAEGREQELTRLRDRHILSPMQAQAIDLRKIGAFFDSELYREIRQSPFVRREFKFSILVPAGEYFPEAAALPEERVLLQGVIDCLYENPAGELVVVDFKTDRVRPGDAANRAKRYQNQLAAYQRAVQEVFDRPASRAALFFLHIGKTVPLRDHSSHG